MAYELAEVGLRPHLFMALAFILLGATQAMSGGAWPAKPVRVIVPFGAGSLADIVPRIVFDEVSTEFHQTFVVENRGGAGTILGTEVVAKSSPDGYTILANSSAQVIAPLLYEEIPFNPRRDFAAVVPIAVVTDVLVVSPTKDIKNLRQFVDWAKAKRGSSTFASLGVGSAIYMNAQRFNRSAGIEATHVGFKGASAAIAEVIEGRVDYCFCAIGTTLPYIRAGKLLALAVSTPQRSSLLPDTPTTLEAGFPQSDYTPWLGIFVPIRTPPDVIAKLHNEITKTLQVPAVREKLRKLGVMPLTMSRNDFNAFVKYEAALDAKLVGTLGLKPH